jgi:predicted enzyme related to lactoylglutathione lyase
MKMSPVVHFEMPAEDRDRMSKFYQKVFGWQTQQMGEEMGNYVVVTTADTDPETRMVKTPGTINGGFIKKTQVMKVKDILLW